MEAWLRDDDGRLLAVYSRYGLSVQPGANREDILLLVTKLFAEVIAAPKGQMVYSGGHRYPWPSSATGTAGALD